MRPQPITLTCRFCDSSFRPNSRNPQFCSRSCYRRFKLAPEQTSHRFWSKVDKDGECWLWTASLGTTGYGQIGHRGKMVKAHRVAWELTNGPIPNGMYVCHQCDNPPCVRPDHLFLGSPAANTKDMVDKGRAGATLHPERVPRGDRHGAHTHPEKMARGERHPNTHLTATDVIAIRARFANGEVQQAIADDYGVCRATVQNIAKRKAWGHVR